MAIHFLYDELRNIPSPIFGKSGSSLLWLLVNVDEQS